MSGSDVEHVSCLPDSRPHQFRRQSSSSSNGAYYHSPLERSLDTPQTVAVSSSLTREPLVETYPSQSAAVASLTSCVPASVSSKVQFENHNQKDRASPDPDEFYRPHPPVVVEGSESALNSSDTSMIGESGPATENRSTYAQRALSLTAKAGELPRGSIAQNRSVSDSYYRGRGSNQINGAEVATLTARPRQTSFKDLVNKFNQTVDQVLPLPTTSSSASKSPSRAPSPIGLVDSTVRPRTPSQLRELRDLPKARREPPSRWKSIDLPRKISCRDHLRQAWSTTVPWKLRRHRYLGVRSVDCSQLIQEFRDPDWEFRHICDVEVLREAFPARILPSLTIQIVQLG